MRRTKKARVVHPRNGSLRRRQGSAADAIGPATESTPASLDALLLDLAAFVRRYVVLSAEAMTATALWIAHTHVVDASLVTPYLAVTSPTKRCGKTRFLEVVESLVRAAWLTVQPSAAVLFRRIERDNPTLLLDEADAIFKQRSESAEALRGILNAGNRRGAVVSRCVGNDYDLRDFKVFCPKAIAGIGTLPETITDRSVPVRLERRKRQEPVARLRRRAFDGEAKLLLARLETWASVAVENLRGAEPDVPKEINDRAGESWEPLLAIAELAGGNWPTRARGTAVVLHFDSRADTESESVALLRAIHAVFAARHVARLLTNDLLKALAERDGEPWGGLWSKDIENGNIKGPGHHVARLLHPFGITSRDLRVGSNRGKGYQRDDFADAFSRYL